MAEMAEIADDARSEAAAAVARLLTMPDDLAKIPKLRAEYAQKLAANEAHLSTNVQTQVEEARTALTLLATSQSTLSDLESNFGTISELCLAWAELTEHQEVLNLLSSTRENLAATLRTVEMLTPIPNDVAAARALLPEPAQLLVCYEYLITLESQVRYAQRALGDTPGFSDGHLAESMRLYREYAAEFEETLWGYIRAFARLPKAHPNTLVRALRVVEQQEIVDGELMARMADVMLADAAAMDSGSIGRGWRKKCVRVIEATVMSDFQPILDECATASNMRDMIDMAREQLELLTDISDYAAPCFPPHYRIFDTVAALYNRCVRGMLARLAGRANKVSNRDILDFYEWIRDEFNKRLADLGVDESLAQPILPTDTSRPKPTMMDDDDAKKDAAAAAKAAATDEAAPKGGKGGSKDGKGAPAAEEGQISLDAFLSGLNSTDAPAAKAAEGAAGAEVDDEEEEEEEEDDDGEDEEEDGDGGAAARKRRRTRKLERKKKRPEPVGDPNLDTLIDMYMNRMAEDLKKFYSNLIAQDRVAGPRPDKHGRLHTSATLETFRILNDQIDSIKRKDSGELLFRVAQTAVLVMVGYQSAVRRSLQDKAENIGLEHLCAQLNNCVSASDQARDLAEAMDESLAVAYRGLVDLDEPCKGFMDIAGEAQALLVDLICTDPNLLGFLKDDLFTTAQLRNGKDVFESRWLDKDDCVIDTIVVTLVDYLEDVNVLVDDAYCLKVVVGVLVKFATMYVDRMLERAPTLRRETKLSERIRRQLEKDELQVSLGFEQYLTKKKVAREMARWQNVRDMAFASDLAAFILAAQGYLQTQPDTEPSFLLKMLTSRTEFPSKARAEGAEQIKAMFAPPAPPPAPAAKGAKDSGKGGKK